MEKIKSLTLKEYESLKKSSNKVELLKELVGIDKGLKYEVGDTAITVDNAKELEIYKGDDTYYLVNRVMGTTLAFTWSLYPV